MIYYILNNVDVEFYHQQPNGQESVWLSLKEISLFVYEIFIIIS